MLNEKTIRQWWTLFVEGFTEVRILGRFQYSGYYKDVENLIRDLQPYEEMSDEQIYFTLNQIEEGCYGRIQCEKILKSPKTTTSDGNIIRRRWVLIDFDPVRAAGTNATEEEFEFAHKKAQTVFRYLKEEGFYDPVICKSGNGWHLLYRIDMPNTDESKDLLSKFLQSVSLLFTDERVDIDESVFNASRICKLYGTTAKKGANIPERPWRMSEIVYVPQDLRVNPDDLFKKIAKQSEEEVEVPTRNYTDNRDFEIETFLREHGIGFTVSNCAKWTKYVLNECFFNHEHKHKDAAIIKLQSGAIKYVCLHNSCQGHTWHEMRQILDPQAYNRPHTEVYKPRVYNPPAVEIKPETAEIGKKWLSLSDIEDDNLDDLPRIRTGFRKIDNAIGGGLFYGECTILSGINGSGKSSFLNTLIANAVNDNVKTALWTGELKAKRLKRWLVQAIAGNRHVVESRISQGKYYTPKPVTEQIVKWMQGKFYLYNNDYSANQAQLLADLEEVVNNGVRLIILDNLFAMDLEGLEGDENRQQKQLILKISDYAKKNNVHIILVAHPRKVVTFLRKEDILGTSALQNAVDNIFIIHRTGYDFSRKGKEIFSPKVIDDLMGYGNVIEICKNREFGAMEKLVGILYDMMSRRFSDDWSTDKRYGWEAEPVQQTMQFDVRTVYEPEREEDVPFEQTDEEAPPF